MKGVNDFMQTNVLEYLENAINRVPDKVAYAGELQSITFIELYKKARAIATFLNKNSFYREPVMIFMNRHPNAIISYLGAVYSRNFYVPVDEEMPLARIKLIMEVIKPGAVICDSKTKETINSFGYDIKTLLYDDIIKTDIDEKRLKEIRNSAIDTDPVYIVFTSGSTGVPKGVCTSHKSIIDYIDVLSETLGYNEDTVFGNQTPLYVDACLKELYPTLKFGVTTYIIPKSLFLFPIKLVEYLNENKINTINWVVSALTMISAFGVLNKVIPEYVHTVSFTGEVFPIKQFLMWKKALPGASFTNLYGPTEATGVCCYYKVEREFGLDEFIPVGRPFKNIEIILLTEESKQAEYGETGEICIKGSTLTLGYYNAVEKTKEVFIQNPLNKSYPEIIYKTGDLGKYNSYGELEFVSRKDNQIKHMGNRIELGDIEANVNAIEEIKLSCCVYNREREKIFLYYVGDISIGDLAARLKEKIQRYMIPNKFVQLEKMPLTTNAKIDRRYLLELSKKKKERK
jgi:D-alanine--poly(phosphoribitol) ligase subunit 1